MLLFLAVFVVRSCVFVKRYKLHCTDVLYTDMVKSAFLSKRLSLYGEWGKKTAVRDLDGQELFRKRNALHCPSSPFSMHIHHLTHFAHDPERFKKFLNECGASGAR